MGEGIACTLRANAQLTGFILVGSSKALCIGYIHVNEHIFMYVKRTYFYLQWYFNPELSVIKLLQIRLYTGLLPTGVDSW